MPVAPKEAERITANHFAALKLGLTWAEGRVGVEPAWEASLTAAVRAGAEPTQRDRLIDAVMPIAPIQLEALLLAKNTNRDRCSLCWFLHKRILGFAGNRQMCG